MLRTPTAEMHTPDAPVDAPAPSHVEAAPAPATARRKHLGWTFWAGILFGLVCIFLGAVVGVWGARIVPSGPPIAEAPRELPPEPGQDPATPAPAPTAQAAPFDPASDTYALEQRLARLQAEDRDRTEAARAALAVSALTQAAQGSAAFAAQVDVYSEVLPPGEPTDALRQLAAQGAPTRAMLAQTFPDAAADAAAAARRAGPAPGFFARVARLFAGLVQVRRTDRLTGAGADAVLARAEAAMDRGDLSAAVDEAGTLPPAARAAMAPWRQGAERRLAIEARLAALRADALDRLNRADTEIGG